MSCSYEVSYANNRCIPGTTVSGRSEYGHENTQKHTDTNTKRLYKITKKIGGRTFIRCHSAVQAQIQKYVTISHGQTFLKKTARRVAFLLGLNMYLFLAQSDKE